MDLITGEIGLHAAPIIVNDVVVIGAAHLPGGAPRSRRNEKGYVRGYDVRTGKAPLDLPHDPASPASSATRRG